MNNLNEEMEGRLLGQRRCWKSGSEENSAGETKELERFLHKVRGMVRMPKNSASK